MGSTDEGLTVSDIYICKELVYKIASHLDPSTLFVLKSVCRRLSTIPTSSSFQSLYIGPEESEFHTPFLVGSSGPNVPGAPDHSPDGNWGLFCLSVSGCVWQPFPASVLLPPVQNAPLKLISSEAGLVLIGQESKGLDELEILSVINPLTKLSRRIPSPPSREYRARQLVTDNGAQGYKIIAERTRSFSEQNVNAELKLLIYDSTADDWKWFGSLTTLFLSELHFRGAASLNGTLYCLGITHQIACLFEFDSSKGWRKSNPKVPTYAYPQQSGCPSAGWMEPQGPVVCKPYLFRYQSQLMLVGATLHKYGTKSRWDERSWGDEDVHDIASVEQGVHLWKFDEKRSEWQYCESMRMPKALFNRSAKTYDFLSSEHYLFVIEVLEGLFDSHRRFRCVLSTGEWQILPSTQAEMRYRDHGLIVYQPRIDSVC